MSVPANGTVTDRWLYGAGPNPVAQLDASGDVTARYVYATNPTAPDLIHRAGDTPVGAGAGVGVNGRRSRHPLADVADGGHDSHACRVLRGGDRRDNDDLEVRVSGRRAMGAATVAVLIITSLLHGNAAILLLVSGALIMIVGSDLVDDEATCPALHQRPSGARAELVAVTEQFRHELGIETRTQRSASAPPA